MELRATAINQLKKTNAGNEVLADFTRILDEIAAGIPVDPLRLKLTRNMSAEGAMALLEALHTYRRELDWQRHVTANVMRDIAALYDIENPAAPPSRRW